MRLGDPMVDIPPPLLRDPPPPQDRPRPPFLLRARAGQGTGEGLRQLRILQPLVNRPPGPHGQPPPPPEGKGGGSR